MSNLRETEDVLEELAELKVKKGEIEQEIKEMQDWIFNYGKDVEKYESEHGVLRRVAAKKYEIEDQSKIIRSLRGMGYSNKEMLVMTKFQIGELRRRVGDDKIHRWVRNGGAKETVNKYYRLSRHETLE